MTNVKGGIRRVSGDGGETWAIRMLSMPTLARHAKVTSAITVKVCRAGARSTCESAQHDGKVQDRRIADFFSVGVAQDIREAQANRQSAEPGSKGAAEAEELAGWKDRRGNAMR